MSFVQNEQSASNTQYNDFKLIANNHFLKLILEQLFVFQKLFLMLSSVRIVLTEVETKSNIF